MYRNILKNIIFSFGLLFSFQALAQKQEKPKLIIGIVVDQMRAEYLYRFQEHYSENGFKRLIREGYNVKNMNYNYVPTATGPGHASIFSGTTPENHGIVGNDWYDRRLKRAIYCAEDTTAYLVNNRNIISSELNKYSRSPKNLLTSNFADELKLFTNGRSKVVGLSLKDRGAIFPAGHMADYAFWYHSETGDFITSSYYNTKLPNWLIKFNNQKKADSLLNLTWNTYFPIENYVNSTSDNASFEYHFKGKNAPIFPYNLKDLRKNNGNFSILTEVPQGNTLLTSMAMATIEGEKLGNGNDVDFLTISYSSTDYIGHNFGIRSKELEDTYVRLDRELEKLLIYLDTRVGKNNYLLFLTADHAASDNPVFLKQSKLPGQFFDSKKIALDLNNHLSNQFGNEKYVSFIDKTQIYISDSFRTNQNILESSLQFLQTQVSGIKDVYIPNLRSYVLMNNDVSQIFMNSYNTLNSGDILLNFYSGWMELRSFGTNHGTTSSSDTHVPLLWFGSNIPKGESSKLYTIDQIVPTLSLIIDIPFANSSKKEPILRLLSKE